MQKVSVIKLHYASPQGIHFSVETEVVQYHLRGETLSVNAKKLLGYSVLSGLSIYHLINNSQFQELDAKFNQIIIPR